jgi:hypothetical protein
MTEPVAIVDWDGVKWKAVIGGRALTMFEAAIDAMEWASQGSARHPGILRWHPAGPHTFHGYTKEPAPVATANIIDPADDPTPEDT